MVNNMKCVSPVASTYFSMFVQVLKCTDTEQIIVQAKGKRRLKYFLMFTVDKKGDIIEIEIKIK